MVTEWVLEKCKRSLRGQNEWLFGVAPFGCPFKLDMVIVGKSHIKMLSAINAK